MKNKSMITGSAVALMILGVISLLLPAFASIAMELLFGWLILMGGLLQLFHTVQTRKATGFWYRLLCAVLYAGIGLLFIINPLRALTIFTILLAVFFIAEGVTRCIAGLQSSGSSKLFILLNGAVSILLGCFIWAQWPFDSLWIVGIIFGINMLFAGGSLLAVSRAMDA